MNYFIMLPQPSPSCYQPGYQSDNHFAVDSQEGLGCGNMMICFLGYLGALTGFLIDIKVY